MQRSAADMVVVGDGSPISSVITQQWAQPKKPFLGSRTRFPGNRGVFSFRTSANPSILLLRTGVQQKANQTKNLRNSLAMPNEVTSGLFVLRHRRNI